MEAKAKEINNKKEKQIDLDLERLADQSQIYLGKDKDKIEEDLKQMVLKNSIIKEADLGDISPSINTFQYENIFREDKVEKNFTALDLVSNAKTREDTFILVPMIME